MAKKRNQHSAGFKAKVALAAVQGNKTISELAGQFAVHPTMITQWKKRLVESAAETFETNRSPGKSAADRRRRSGVFDNQRFGQGFTVYFGGPMTPVRAGGRAHPCHPTRVF